MTFIHPDIGPIHLGRPEPSPRTYRSLMKTKLLGAFVDQQIPTPPEVLDLTAGILDWGMMLNDVEGDCTCAACGHQLQSFTGAAGRDAIVTVPDSVIEAEYEAISGYVPGNPATDRGAYITDALDYFRDVGLAGHKISAHAEVNIATQHRIQQAMYVFGALNFGVALPITAQNQIGEVLDLVPGQGDPFDPSDPSFPGSWGGHAMAAVFYSPSGVDFATWGRTQRATWRWIMFYAQEAHACIFPNYAICPEPVAELLDDFSLIGS